jgi:hypothetical protein
MKAISETVAGALVIASLIGGSAAAAAVAGAPATPVHSVPVAATAVEYAL